MVRLRYSVVDTGRGIPSNLHRRIFEPFVRAEEPADSTTKGSGLGLSICAMLLEAMGSSMELESRLGRGSAFSFELIHAIATDVRSEFSEPRPNMNGENAHAKRILIVDDDQDNLEVLGRLVRREGFAVDLVRDGRAALAMTERRDYAMLLTDMRMSGMDGLELSRRLREREARTKQRAMPLVAITADNLLKGEMNRVVQDSFDAILLKPVRPRVLARLLEPYKPACSGQRGSGDTIPETPTDTTVISLIPDYLRRRSEDLSVLRKFLSGKASIEMVAAIGHNLKGNAHSYGFPRLRQLGAALEKAANANQVQRIASLVDRFERLIGEAQRRGQSTSEMKRLASSRA
jgi:CheY-like chemotaxis protein